MGMGMGMGRAAGPRISSILYEDRVRLLRITCNCSIPLVSVPETLCCLTTVKQYEHRLSCMAYEQSLERIGRRGEHSSTGSDRNLSKARYKHSA